MRFFTAKVKNELKPGLAIDEKAAFFSDLDIFYPNLLSFIKANKNIIVEKKDLVSPLPETPHDAICVGKNYAAHIEEIAKKIDEDTREIAHYFSKRTGDIKGHRETIEPFFNLDSTVDYEVELAVIIGKEGREIEKKDVWDHIFGFTILNDISSRFMQKNHSQWYRGKSLDGYISMGPWIVTKDEFKNPLELDIKTYINDELRQNSNTRLMIYTIEDIINEISQGIKLVPGDIIATGTPEGVGWGFDPPKFLKSGDFIRMDIEKIGSLENYIK